MSVLGAAVRARPENLEPLLRSLQAQPGVDVALNPGDGRLVLVLEDAEQPAAAAPAAIALRPEVLSVSLVYEYSGPDAPAPDTGTDYRAWRGSLATRAPA